MARYITVMLGIVKLNSDARKDNSSKQKGIFCIIWSNHYCYNEAVSIHFVVCSTLYIFGLTMPLPLQSLFLQYYLLMMERQLMDSVIRWA